MAYNEHQAERIRQRLSKSNLTDEKKMMGGLIFMVNDKMCVGLDIDKKTGKDRLMVRVGKAKHDQLIFNKGSREMDFTGKVMRGFLYIDPEGFDVENDLDFWIEKALHFNRAIS
ncbi:TfoX/Sxy family protein [Mangrovivirga cuniculi]|uniref:RNA methyltransferase n=1 Tax=Mangrovivirga cuniculi TaxID=2715131 RepID=A0A4D7JQ76_9BACT|nr:TfoX/Sxy family protein [Mangrovivirga cuniculi]QCK15630.1 RNA methyltransferase [Mangrovivirga cuniculi]